MKKLLFVLAICVLFALPSFAADYWKYFQTCSRTTAAMDTIVSTTVDTTLYVYSTGGKRLIGLLVKTDDNLATDTAEDSAYVSIWGSVDADPKTSANWALIRTATLTGTDSDKAHNVLLYIEGDGTYLYNMPYLRATIYQCEGAAATDSMRYTLYWYGLND